MIDPIRWTREELERHSVDMRQFIDFRQSTLPNGMRIIEAYNSSGLTFTILPDRGLDIWTAHYKGIPLTWISQGSPHPPDFGETWLQQFNGGLLTTCGLTHAGPPERDDITGEWRDLHGRYSRLRAGDLETHTGTWDTDKSYSTWISGSVSESALFGTQLRLHRRYALRLGEPKLRILDTVTNVSDQPTPLMLLYHINPGFPVVQEGAQLVTAHAAVYPRDDAAKPGFERWADYDGATAGYAEQVFYHQPFQYEHWSSAMLYKDDFGMRIDWNSDNLPYLTQWKNTRQGIYVCGIEPGNCLPEGQNAARRNNRLQILQPGEQISFACQISVVDRQEAIEQVKREIERISQRGTPVAGCHLEDFADGT